MKITEKQVREQLENVYDPELNVSIVDLGLVYTITVTEPNKVHIKMTLTTMGCPLYETIEQDVRAQLRPLGLVNEDISLELTFDPPWSMDRMSERAKAMLGI